MEQFDRVICEYTNGKSKVHPCMEWNPSEDCVNTRAHSEIDRLHSFKISNMDNVYPLLPGTRIRLEVIGKMFEDLRWREEAFSQSSGL